MMQPTDIERLSFEIIAKEAGPHGFDPGQWQVVRRMIHTSADFEYLESVRFHPRALDAGIDAICQGKNIITDTNMAKTGIRKMELAKFGVAVKCLMGDAAVAATAVKNKTTRARAAVDAALDHIQGGIYVVGNAPTALLRLIELVQTGQARPALIIGLPVGFVNAAESKAALLELDVPYITNVGRKGGSNLAASVVNALAIMAGSPREIRRQKPEKGTFYGIGVGPGDPDLITLKAQKILKQTDIVYAASSTKNNHSLALEIAKQHIRPEAQVQLLAFPMSIDSDETRKAWEDHARTIIAQLKQGRSVVFVTLGDAMTYSTYGYLLKYIRKLAPQQAIISIPGITSYQAAAARLNLPLVEGEESLLINSGAFGGDRLRRFNEKPENVVFMKAYRNVKDITQAIDETGLYDTSVGVIKCGRDDEQICTDMNQLAQQQPDYWTLIICKQIKGKPASGKQVK